MSKVVITSSRATLPNVLRAAGMLFTSILISGALYTLATPHLSHFLADIGRPADQIPWWSIVLLRALEVLGYASFGFTNTKDIIMLSVISRTAYATMLCFFFNVPPGIPALTTVIDTLSIWLPILAIYKEPNGRPVKRREISKEVSLTVILTLISASFLSISAYTAIKTFLPQFINAHFDLLRTTPVIPLPFLVAGFIPSGYCLQEIIYRHGFHVGTITVLVSSFVVGCGNIALAIRGGDAAGVLGVVQLWNASLTVTSAIIGYILNP